MEGRAFRTKESTSREGAAANEGIVGVTKSPEGRKDIEVTFLYVHHTPENVDQIWEKAKDADLILVEAVTSAEEKENLTEEWNDLTENPLNSESEGVRREYEQSDRFHHRLVSKMVGTGKRIELIDVSVEEDEGQMEETILDRPYALAIEGETDKAYQAFCSRMEWEVSSNKSRENTVVAQVERRITNLKGPKKVAVIQGATHTPTYHKIKDGRAFPARYSFVPTRITQYPCNVLTRKKRFFPDKEIPESEYRRAFAADVLVTLATPILLPGASEHQQGNFTIELHAHLTDKDVEDSLDKFTRRQIRNAANVDNFSTDELVDRVGISITHSAYASPEDLQGEASELRRLEKTKRASELAADIVGKLARKYHVQPGVEGDT